MYHHHTQRVARCNTGSSSIAIHAEAAIQRVREFLADKDEGLTDDARAQGHFILVDTDSVRRALDGDA